METMDLIRVYDGKTRYMNYKDYIFWIKDRCCKLFLTNQFHPLGGRMKLDNSIQPLLELLIVEIDLNVAQEEEKVSKSNILLMSASRKVSLKRRDFLSLSNI